MDLDKAKQTFILEARELLAAMEEALLGLEDNEDPGESINAMFRAVHTIKGSAGLFGLDPIVRFAHTVESVMDRVRGKKITLDPPLVGILLECHDHLEELISSTQEGVEEAPGSREVSQRLLGGLAPYLEGHGVAERASATLATRPAGPSSERWNECWHLSIRFGPDVLRNGMDPLSFIRYLGTLGRLVHLASVVGSLPQGEDYDPEGCYLGIELDLETDAERQTIEDVFEFVREDSEIRLLPPDSKVQAEKLDRLVDLVGELVSAGASVNALAASSHNGPLLEATTVVNKLVEEIRDNALGLRMVQIGETFNRFRRIVRDVSQEMGKSIELEVHGGDTVPVIPEDGRPSLSGLGSARQVAKVPRGAAPRAASHMRA